MTGTVWPVNAVAGAPSYSGKMIRQAMSSLVGGASATRPLGGQSGVRPGTPQTIVTATSTVWTVTPFSGVIDAEASAVAGPYQFAFDANVTGSVTAADATYSRWDTLAVQVSDPVEDGSGTPSIAIVYTAGTAAASPAEPTLPARSFLLARIVVPKSGTGSPSVVWRAPVCAAAGGVYLEPSTEQTTALDALALATGVATYIDDGTGLKRSAGAGFVPVAATSGVSGVLAGTAPAVGTPLVTKSFYGALGSTNANGIATVTFPGGAFAHGVTAVQVNLARADGTAQSAYTLQVGACTLSAVDVRVAQLVSGAFAFASGVTPYVSLRAEGW